MTKELDLVNELIKGIDNYEKQTGIKNPPVYVGRELLVEIKQALQRLESIENAKPSEALEAVENLRGFTHRFSMVGYLDANEDLDAIKEYILKAQEQERVIKEILFLINDLEPTFNRKGVSSDTDILGTIIKDYFYNNASKLLKRYFNEEKN